MCDLARREFLVACGPIGPPGALGATAFHNQPMEPAGNIRLGYAAITWSGQDDQAIADISSVGFKAIQLRSSTFATYVTRPAVLKDLLAKHGLTFAIHSSVDLKYQPRDRRAMLDLHLSHAKFVRDAGGQFLQVIDELPRARPVTQDDYRALAETLNALGERTKAIGVQLVYHNHMNSTGETPEALAAIMAATGADSVGLLFDIAHYTQGGGDPVEAIHRYGRAIAAVHLKDVRTIDAAPGYQWIELGRGHVDVKGSVAALQEVGFDGWAIVELDQVPDPGGSPRASAQANRDYVTKLGLKL